MNNGADVQNESESGSEISDSDYEDISVIKESTPGKKSDISKENNSKSLEDLNDKKFSKKEKKQHINM